MAIESTIVNKPHPSPDGIETGGLSRILLEMLWDFPRETALLA